MKHEYYILSYDLQAATLLNRYLPIMADNYKQKFIHKSLFCTYSQLHVLHIVIIIIITYLLVLLLPTNKMDFATKHISLLFLESARQLITDLLNTLSLVKKARRRKQNNITKQLDHV